MKLRKMHSKYLFQSLSVYALLRANLNALASAEVVQSNSLLPEGLGLDSFGKFDIISVHSEGDEDVVRLRKRGNEDCNDTDCLVYSGWEPSERQVCENANEDDNILERSILQRRDRKDSELCEGVRLPGQLNPEPGFGIFGPTWRTTSALEKDYHRVYDIGDPRYPEDPAWFQLTKRDSKWTSNLVGVQGQRCYSAEHVLEWQLLNDFIKEDKDNPSPGKESRCVAIMKYFLEPMTLKDTTVKVAINPNKALTDKDNKFEYIDTPYKWSKMKMPEFNKKDFPLLHGLKSPRLIDYIGFQWPGTKRGTPNNPWEYELVVLNADANNRKAVVWGNEKIFTEPETDPGDPKLMKKVQTNSDTLEWLFINKYYKDGIKTWEDNKGKCKAIYQYNTAMNVVQYHNDHYIKEVMRAQVNRVADAWEYLETEVLPNMKGFNGVPYQYRGLKDEWITFMKSAHKKHLERLNTALDEKISVFQGTSNFKTNVKRWTGIEKWDYFGVFPRESGPKTPNCGFEKDDKKIEERVTLLKRAKQSLPKAETELKLD